MADRPGRIDRRWWALAAIMLTAVAASGCSSSGSMRPDSASVTIGSQHAALTVTACSQAHHALHVVAQAGGTWTLDLRHDTATKTNILVVVQRSDGHTISYQASASAVHPAGTPPTKIAVDTHGSSVSGTATVLRSSSAAAGRPTTAHASFRLTCAKVGALGAS